MKAFTTHWKKEKLDSSSFVCLFNGLTYPLQRRLSIGKSPINTGSPQLIKHLAKHSLHVGKERLDFIRCVRLPNGLNYLLQPRVGLQESPIKTGHTLLPKHFKNNYQTFIFSPGVSKIPEVLSSRRFSLLKSPISTTNMGLSALTETVMLR